MGISSHREFSTRCCKFHVFFFRMKVLFILLLICFLKMMDSRLNEEQSMANITMNISHGNQEKSNSVAVVKLYSKRSTLEGSLFITFNSGFCMVIDPKDEHNRTFLDSNAAFEYDVSAPVNSSRSIDAHSLIIKDRERVYPDQLIRIKTFLANDWGLSNEESQDDDLWRGKKGKRHLWNAKEIHNDVELRIPEDIPSCFCNGLGSTMDSYKRYPSTHPSSRQPTSSIEGSHCEIRIPFYLNLHYPEPDFTAGSEIKIPQQLEDLRSESTSLSSLLSVKPNFKPFIPLPLLTNGNWGFTWKEAVRLTLRFFFPFLRRSSTRCTSLFCADERLYGFLNDVMTTSSKPDVIINGITRDTIFNNRLAAIIQSRSSKLVSTIQQPLLEKLDSSVDLLLVVGEAAANLINAPMRPLFVGGTFTDSGRPTGSERHLDPSLNSTVVPDPSSNYSFKAWKEAAVEEWEKGDLGKIIKKFLFLLQDGGISHHPFPPLLPSLHSFFSFHGPSSSFHPFDSYFALSSLHMLRGFLLDPFFYHQNYLSWALEETDEEAKDERCAIPSGPFMLVTNAVYVDSKKDPFTNSTPHFNTIRSRIQRTIDPGIWNQSESQANHIPIWVLLNTGIEDRDLKCSLDSVNKNSSKSLHHHNHDHSSHPHLETLAKNTNTALTNHYGSIEWLLNESEAIDFENTELRLKNNARFRSMNNVDVDNLSRHAMEPFESSTEFYLRSIPKSNDSNAKCLRTTECNREPTLESSSKPPSSSSLSSSQNSHSSPIAVRLEVAAIVTCLAFALGRCLSTRGSRGSQVQDVHQAAAREKGGEGEIQHTSMGRALVMTNGLLPEDPPGECESDPHFNLDSATQEEGSTFSALVATAVSSSLPSPSLASFSPPLKSSSFSPSPMKRPSAFRCVSEGLRRASAFVATRAVGSGIGSNDDYNSSTTLLPPIIPPTSTPLPLRPSGMNSTNDNNHLSNYDQDLNERHVTSLADSPPKTKMASQFSVSSALSDLSPRVLKLMAAGKLSGNNWGRDDDGRLRRFSARTTSIIYRLMTSAAGSEADGGEGGEGSGGGGGEANRGGTEEREGGEGSE